MKAAWFESFGTAADTLIIGEQEKPTPGAGEVLVKLEYTCPNPSDVKKRAGAFPNLLDNGHVIPNSDGSGVIEAVGEGVDASRIGERVFVYQGQYGRLLGTAAEYIAIESSRAPTLPDEAPMEVGALIGIPVMTAHRCVHADGDVAGKTILVTGGAGRVGYYAIQWAKAAGAKVVATASNPADEATCKEVGADLVVNHREANWGEAVVTALGGEKVDRVVDVEFGANLPEVLKCLKINGVIATYSSTQVKEPQLPFIQMMFMDLTLRMVIVYAMPEEAKMHAIADTQRMLSEGKLKHRIAHNLPFSEMVKSNELIEQGGFGGCVVVQVTA
ncbi:NADPH:quinone reductase [uncultured Umboniibacter sp.]|uniref:NADPH:quinone reductase n=1 Tax=uncultured Umboniibacter sp. TaxID=1798917 RepID=UPI0026266C58|nr:NADPH:quinone reductase [uncultured Umboniibacter sp.]